LVCLERRDENLPGSHVFVEARHRSHRCQAQNFAGDRFATHSPGSEIETGQVAGDEVGRTLQTATEAAADAESPFDRSGPPGAVVPVIEFLRRPDVRT
jgi:hypothetical protein